MQGGITSRGFKALLITQFLGAFNDNAFKLFVSLLAVNFFVNKQGGTQYLSLSGAVFVLPFLLFSMTAGFLADRFSKRKVIVGAKMAEVLIMFIGFLAFYYGNLFSMLCVLFLMGAQSTFFSPAKYGILPEILKEEELSEGNGAIQLWTYVAIILGTAAGGYIFSLTKTSIYKAAYFFITLSSLGVITSLFVTKVSPSGAKRNFEYNFLREIYQNVKRIQSNRPIFLAILGLVYFGFLGGFFQLNILLYARKVMGIGNFETSLLLTLVALGLGIGSFGAGKLSEHRIEFGLVPLGAIGLSLFSIFLGFAHKSFLAVTACLLLLGISSGFFIVPLNTFIQKSSPTDRRGQILATNNCLSFFAILSASGILYVFRDLIRLNAAQIFIVLGLLTIGVTIYICRLLPEALLRFVLWALTHTIYKIKAVGHENLPKEGGALLVSNHVSYVDGLLICALTQRPIRFIVNRQVYYSKRFHHIFKLAQAIPISNKDTPKEIFRALNTAREFLKKGELVCIFAEGALTRIGNIMKFNKGVEHIMKGMDCPIIPIHLDRVWGSIFSFERGKYIFKMPKMIPYPVTVSFGEPMNPQSTAFQIHNRVLELGADAFKYRLDNKDTLPEGFWREARRHPLRFCVADSSGKRMSYATTLILSVALSRIIKEKFFQEKTIGVLLPPSIAAVITNIAVSLTRKIPVNLNYTTSEETIAHVVAESNIFHIITSKIFVRKARLSITENMVFIEDVIANLSKRDKFIAALKSFFFPSVISKWWIFGKGKNRDIEDIATVMFTSGSTGIPKGVMLTHANILSNLQGLYQVFYVNENDIVMGVLPFFHSFGYTATLWFPLLSGISSVYHANPLDGRVVGEMVQKYKATILMSTPTFLMSYVHRCSESQFRSLRIAIVGAEKLKDRIANVFKDKFGMEPMEGYGCTELSPIVSINLPDYKGDDITQKSHKPTKIGRPIPGVVAQILDQETHQPLGPNENGLLFVKGPNVMKGYLNQPEETSKAIRNGWYATGDIANIDEDGFLMITDRLSRFSKIAGEMIPHIKVEETIHSILNAIEQMCVVTSIPDDKKGEKLVVLHKDNIDAKTLLLAMRERNLPKLWIPDTDMFYKMDSFPLLGSGKLDLGAIKRKALELASGEEI